MTEIQIAAGDAADLTARGSRVGLRTLVMIRWVAVTGQTATLLTVHFGFGFELPIVAALGVVAASALFNLALVTRRSMTTQISHGEASAHLAYDIVQLSLLLFLTGGLRNPFALLILAPVTVSATVLPRLNTVALGVMAAVATTVLSVAHLPLPPLDPPLIMPDIYLLGVWEAMILGTLFIAAYVGSVSEEARRRAAALTAARLALAREHQLSAMGALAAAAAHELGSPLGTIAVTAREMAREVPPESDLARDVALLLEQSERCRSILQRLGEPLSPDALSPMSRLPLGALVESAALPYLKAEIDTRFETESEDGSRAGEPVVERRAELVQGIGTLIQNAIEFAAHEVTVTTSWDADTARVEIADDGPGFPRAVLDRLGEPYISTRAGEKGHMGLGIFIALTLLEYGGAKVTCSNDPTGGALVQIVWPRLRLEETSDEPARSPMTT